MLCLNSGRRLQYLALASRHVGLPHSNPQPRNLKLARLSTFQPYNPAASSGVPADPVAVIQHLIPGIGVQERC